MQYFSTRDATKTRRSFTDVLLAGLAPDGGLYVPEEYPLLSAGDIDDLRSCTYAEVAFSVIQRFVGSAIPSDDLKRLIETTYTAEVFQSDEITPIEPILPGIWLQDLSQGPSLAFKDLAMQFLGHVMDYELARQDRHLRILGASSGDTVSAAEEAMRGKSRVSVIMLTPKTGMSAFQKAQAGSILDDNIYNISVPGPFDTCQDIVKEINRDAEFKRRYAIGAVNSINWGRITAQIVYYVWSVIQFLNNGHSQVDVVVPSGNFGNVLAGYMAKRMGLPIRRLIVSTNENTVLNQFFQTGIYQQQDVIVTSSPSMDISKASNIERYFFDVLERDPSRLAELMNEFDTTKRIDLSAYLTAIQNKDEFSSGSATHQDRLEMIKRVYAASKRVIDPHTAAGVKTAIDQQIDECPMICMETAKPAKFEATVQEALGFVPDRPAAYKGLEQKEQRFYDCDDKADNIKSFIVQNFGEV